MSTHPPLFSARITEWLSIGKYTRWVQTWTAPEFCRVMSDVAGFDAAVFPPGAPRSLFPVIDPSHFLGVPLRVQYPLESLCLILEPTREERAATGGPADAVARIERLGSPLAPLEKASPGVWAFADPVRAALASAPDTAGVATLDEAAGWALLWSLGEIQARACDQDPARPSAWIVSSKRYAEPFALRREGTAPDSPWSKAFGTWNTPAELPPDATAFAAPHLAAMEASLRRLLTTLCPSYVDLANRPDSTRERPL